MSWFNSSLNSLKGQISTFAQEVLAENAENEEEPSVSQVLDESQRRNEELSSQCAAKDSEIASLRKQISDLLAKNSDNGKSTKSTASAIDKNASLEDSWCWEPDNVPSESSGKRDRERSSESSSGGGELIAIPLDGHSSHDNELIEKYQRFLDERDGRLKLLTVENTALHEKLHRLTDENVELQSNLEELDNQHNVAMKEVLDMKNEWQTKWNLLNEQQKSLVQEHELKVGSMQKDLETLQKKFESIQSAYAIYVQENEVLKLELEKARSDVKVIQEEKATIASANTDVKQFEEKITQLQEQLQKTETAKAELEAQLVAEGPKKCKDEDDFIVLQNEDLSSNNFEQKYSTLLTEKERIHLERDALQRELDDVKSTHEIMKVQFEGKIQTLTEELSNLKAAGSSNEAETDQLKKQLSELTETVEKNTASTLEEESKMKAENIKLQKQIIDLESSINKSNVKTSDHIENVLSFHDLNQLITLYTKVESPIVDDISSLETVFKAIGDKIWKVEVLEKNLKEMADEVLRLKNEKASIDHQKTTLRADIEHYEAECAELMKNNEILLNELENYKRNKLETIPENNEEGIVMMEKQLEESNSYLRNLEDQYNETIEKLIQADEKRYELEDIIETLQESNGTMTNDIKQLKDQIETLENEKSNLIFEINEMKTDDKKSAVEMEIHEYKSKYEKLQLDYEQLSKELSELQSSTSNASNDNTLSTQMSSLKYANESLVSEKAALENEVQVLQSQFEHYEMKCAHLKEDNEMLRKELEDIQGKLTSQHIVTDDVDNLRRQLEEAHSSTRCIEDRFNEISQKVVELELQNNELRSELVGQQDNNTNLMSELITLKDQVERLETDNNKLVFEINELRTDDNKSQAVMKTKLLQYEANIDSLECQLDRLSKDHADLVAAMQGQKANFSESRKKYEDRISSLETALKDQQNENRKSDEKLKEAQNTIEKHQNEIAELEEKLLAEQEVLLGTSDDSTIAELNELKQQINSMTQEKANLIATVTTKHNENTQYYMEIQRLNQLLQTELEKSQNAATATCEKCRQLQATIDENLSTYRNETEKLHDQINFLKEKSDILTTNLITEQTNQKLLMQEKSELMEKNAMLQRDLERLRGHLVEMEEAHTQETLELQNSMEDTKAKMMSLQKEVSNSSNAYTSASIRASQHAETLQAQYLLVCQQRDEYAAKLSAAEDKESKNQAALVNLQCALEQFQKEKDSAIHSATMRLRKELQNEQEKQNDLQAEIKSFQNKLADANQGLLAAARLSDQLEVSQVTIASLKEEIDSHKEKISILEQKLKSTQESQADKVEKNLVKSLLIGYIVSSNPNDKTQILKLITTVLDFTSNETDRVGLNKTQSGWLTGLILGGSGQTGGDQSKKSLVQEFVNFLEKESQPQTAAANVPNLLNIRHDPFSPSTSSSTSSGAQNERRLSQQSNSSMSGIKPILVNENILEQYAPLRNSSSILKDILRDS